MLWVSEYHQQKVIRVVQQLNITLPLPKQPIRHLPQHLRRHLHILFPKTEHLIHHYPINLLSTHVLELSRLQQRLKYLLNLLTLVEILGEVLNCLLA